MKSSWIGIGFSHHKVPSLSKTATRSSIGTVADPSAPQIRSTNSTIACLVGPSRQPDSNSAFTVTFRSCLCARGRFLPASVRRVMAKPAILAHG
jgi:hypothetical protein